MAGGDPAADAVARDNLVVILSVKSGRFRLGKKVKSALATYLSQTLELETLEEIESLGAKGFGEALAAACEGKDVPEALKSGALEWFACLDTESADGAGSPAKTRTAAPKKGHGRASATFARGVDTDDDDDAESIVSLGAGLSPVNSDKQAADEARMKLSGDQIQALHTVQCIREGW